MKGRNESHARGAKVDQGIIIMMIGVLCLILTGNIHAADTVAQAPAVQMTSQDDCSTVICPQSYKGPISEKMNKCCKPVVLQKPAGKEAAAGANFNCFAVAGCDLCCGSGSQGCTVCGCSPNKTFICDQAGDEKVKSTKALSQTMAGCMRCWQECIVYEGERCVKTVRTCQWDFDCK